MLGEAFPLGEQIKLHTFDFRLYPKLWVDFDIEDEIIEALEWTETKFLNDDGTDFSDEVKNLPVDSGGIYIFIIKSNVLKGISEYLAYIGRAQFTDNHNLRVRCKRYLSLYLNEKERPKITTLMNYFKNHLFLRYTKVSDNELIVRLEAELINSLLPPFNDEIPNKVVRQAINAF